MRLLLLGGGGREHAICQKLSDSPKVEKIYSIPGNPGTAEIEKNENCSLPLSDGSALARFAADQGCDLTVVGPEQPLVDGLADVFRDRQLLVFGPGREGALFEGSKEFAKTFMMDASIPTAQHETLTGPAEARKYLAEATYPLVLKADGLAAGKGVSICADRASAEQVIFEVMEKKIFGTAGEKIVAEEYLEGEEASFLLLLDGESQVILATSQDHKRLRDGDQGPNTGGMGAYSPAPVMTPALIEETQEKIVDPLIRKLRSRSIHFCGVLYIGLMITKEGPKVLEFNVRFGDPETQAILPRLQSDLAEALYATARGQLGDCQVTWKEDAAVNVVLASPGYPTSPKHGTIIHGLETLKDWERLHLFHAGTRREASDLVTSGGRVLSVTGLAPTISEAIRYTYQAVEKIHFEGMTYRKDIGARALKKI